ncbi:Cyclin-D3-1, partial [Cucurbita argyrosperma subsp. sororia]
MALHPHEHTTQRHHNTLFFLHCTHQQHHHQQQHLQTEDPIFHDNGGTHFLEQTTHFVAFEDEELGSLLAKERDQNLQNGDVLERLIERDAALSLARTEAIEWLLKVNTFYGFSSVTALLAINYLDRILSGPHFQRDKPWMLQLLAVTCISLAAKVEEIRVPLLLDLQVEDSKFIFEPKTIQRMELLVLSGLKWKMHPVTPVSFLGIVTKRLGLKNQCIEREFFRRCERILLSLVSDSRSVGFLPSVMAVSAMVSVVEEMGDCNCYCNPLDFQDRLLNALKITKERSKKCCNVIREVTKRETKANRSGKKRKQNEEDEAEEEDDNDDEERSRTSLETETESESEGGGSPNGVMEGNFSCESSNDSWGIEEVTGCCCSKRTKSSEES